MADKSKPAAPTAKDIEADLAASRERLASTIDELAFRAQPKEIARRGAEDVKLKVNAATRTPDGNLATDKIGYAVGGIGAVSLLLGLIRRARS
ncbi:DUF3618 domain-containing protein [Dermatophilaceae bacterium Sec6.4]